MVARQHGRGTSRVENGSVCDCTVSSGCTWYGRWSRDRTADAAKAQSKDSVCDWIHRQRFSNAFQPIPGTRPFPIENVINKAAANGIGMKVLNAVPDGLLVPHVPVVATTRQPESERCFVLAFVDSQACKPVRTSMLDEVSFGRRGNRPFDGSENTADFVRFVDRLNQQVCVLRHHHKRPQAKPLISSCGIERVNEPSRGTVSLQQRPAVDARERK